MSGEDGTGTRRLRDQKGRFQKELDKKKEKSLIWCYIPAQLRDGHTEEGSSDLVAQREQRRGLVTLGWGCQLSTSITEI